MSSPHRARYSCATAAETLQWMNAIAEFIRPFRSLVDAHVVNFFKDRLWETVDKVWMECLRKEPVENLLNIPSGLVMEHWPDSLQKFVIKLQSLVFSREQELPFQLFPDLNVMALGSVLSQGMNLKKKHEVEILAAVVSAIAKSVGAQTIIDVGAGQGYLAQVLSFQYQHCVIAIDSSSHHSEVTSTRAERIKKHYTAKLRKSQHGNENLSGPHTVTCRILSSRTLSALTTGLSHEDPFEQPLTTEKEEEYNGKQSSCYNRETLPSLVLAGLHACGDLSVNMLRTFAESDQVKALVCIGCCYNLLSEECFESNSSQHGFPMSRGARSIGAILGKNARDLACQSADRWRKLSRDAAIQNFDLHAFRAAFQMVLDIYYPEVLSSSPSIGRQGKSLRRQQMRRVLHSQLNDNENMEDSSITDKERSQNVAHGVASKENIGFDQPRKDVIMTSVISSRMAKNVSYRGFGMESNRSCSLEKFDKYALFEEYCNTGLRRLAFELSADANLHRIWKEVHPLSEFVGPFWSLRASLGPLLETYILLDRLLFLQEQACSLQILMLSLFDPAVSPRNVAIIARK